MANHNHFKNICPVCGSWLACKCMCEESDRIITHELCYKCKNENVVTPTGLNTDKQLPPDLWSPNTQETIISFEEIIKELIIEGYKENEIIDICIEAKDIKTKLGLNK
jgi:hypothetical protein